MGVDIQTYRCRIGTFTSGIGKVVTGEHVCTVVLGLFCAMGCFLIIGMLLLIAGVEPNPGPRDIDELESTVLLTGLTERMNKEVIETFFNGIVIDKGKVRNVKMNKVDRSAIIKFDNDTAAKHVLAKPQILLHDSLVIASEYNVNTIEVEGLSPGTLSENDLIKYFETKEISGGDEVENIRWSENRRSARIKFKGGFGVRNILKTPSHAIHGNSLKIKLFEGCFDGMSETSSTDEELSPGTSHGQRTWIRSEFDKLKELLGLKYIITVSDVIAYDPSKRSERSVTYKDLPMHLLRGIAFVNCNIRDDILSDLSMGEFDSKCYSGGNFDDVFDDADEEEERNGENSLSPADIFFVVLQFCDPILTQILYKKLYLCKKALPLISIQFNEKLNKPQLSIWPLRSLQVETVLSINNQQPKETEICVLDLPTVVITFARFGRPRFSKSNLLNALLSDKGANTFYSKECKHGSAERKVTQGLVEISWLLQVGKKDEQFDSSITFLNCRGCIGSYKSPSILQTISHLTDVLVIFLDLSSLMGKVTELHTLLTSFSAIIIVIANHLKRTDQYLVTPLINELNVKDILKTFKGSNEKSVLEMSSDIRTSLNILIKENDKCTLAGRVQKLSNISGLTFDEDGELFTKSKKNALDMIQNMQRASDKLLRSVVTPIQWSIANEIGSRTKLLHRVHRNDRCLHIQHEINEIRCKLLDGVTSPIKLFAKCLVDISNPSLRHMFLAWLNVFIFEKKSKSVLSLINSNIDNKAKLECMRRDESSTEEIKHIEQQIVATDYEIDDLTLNVDHLFRELGYIYETSLVLKEEIEGMPSCHDVAIAVADLLISGNILELIDGDTFLLPVEWIKLVFEAVSNKVGRNNVLSISVLGLQSSGKSTMLNAMFGTQFLASIGRCTKGINMQLIPIKTEEHDSGFPFNFIFLLDTEGLRAPEFCDRKADHDNELATFIVGLGDITILSIKGENPSEINDILHVVIYAFLRLKLANENLDIRKQCYFVHQNVTNILASEKKRRGLEMFQDTLDRATKEAAQIEGIPDVVSFNEIIEFDINTHVWHMPNLWQGSPPMEFVNLEYSNGVLYIKQSIIKNAIQMKYKSFKSFNDTLTHADNLWKGVLSDNFVFAFRNSLEIKAYIKLTEQLNTLYRRVENRENDFFVSTAQTESSSCETEGNLNTKMEQLSLKAKDSVRKSEDFLSSELNKLIDHDENRDITEKWREQMLLHIKEICNDLHHNITNEILRIFRKQKWTILTSDIKLEKEFHEKSVQVANKLKTELKEEEIISKFEDIWRTVFVNVYSSHSTEDVKKAFADATSKQYVRELPILASQQKLYQELPISGKPCSKLSGTVTDIGLDKDDLSTAKFSFMPKIKQRSRNFEDANEKAEEMFAEFDQLICKLCNENPEITNSHICQFVDYVNTISKQYQQKWSWSKKLRVRLIVHIHACAENTFEQHNLRYLKDTNFRLERKKAKGLQIFKAHIDHRKAEEKVAIEFISIIETNIRQMVFTNTTVKAKSALCDVIPTVKYHLIVTILTEMARNETFQEFTHYNSDPEGFANEWIFKKSYIFLFDKKETIKSKYSQIACFQLHMLINSVKSSIFESMKKCIALNSSFDEWIKSFVDSEKKCGTTVRNFDLMKSVLQHEIDFACLQECIVKKLEELKLVLEKEFDAVNKYSVQWDEINPIQYVAENVWGCKARCPFCGEPCALGNQHKGTKHYALQHKPKGIRGHYNPDGKEAGITTCNLDIQMRNKYYPCKLISYACSNKNESCEYKEHRFFDYRDLFPMWDIKPEPTVENCSKFWAWFLVHFKERIAKKYSIKVTKIPPFWQKISKDEAIDSLRIIYS